MNTSVEDRDADKANARDLSGRVDELQRFVERVACYDDYTHDDVDETAILHELQAEARKLLPPEL